MARTELTPQDKEYKKIISSRLNDLLSRSGRKQIDITRSVGIPASTLTGYFKGTRLPSPKNVEKLAEYFNVEKSDIDPRFGRDPKEDNLKTADKNVQLIAAHIDDGTTPEEMNDILTYIDFIKSKREKK
jgi:transcriptional regulator with XRE-family HTH domain